VINSGTENGGMLSFAAMLQLCMTQSAVRFWCETCLEIDGETCGFHQNPLRKERIDKFKDRECFSIPLLHARPLPTDIGTRST